MRTLSFVQIRDKRARERCRYAGVRLVRESKVNTTETSPELSLHLVFEREGDFAQVNWERPKADEEAERYTDDWFRARSCWAPKARPTSSKIA